MSGAGPPEVLADAAWRDRLLRAVLRERTASRRELDELYSQPVAARVEAGHAIDGLEFVGWDAATGRLVFRIPANVSGFRSGDRLRLGRGDDPWNALPADFVDHDPATGRLELAVPWGTEREALDRLVRREPALVLDRGDADLSDPMLRAIQRIYSSTAPHERALRDLIAGRTRSTVDPDAHAAPRDSLARLAARGLTLRPAQAEAYLAAWATRPAPLVQGPPGTGKTWLLALLLVAWAFRGERVLVTAFTHRAVDNALRQAAALVRGAGGGVPVVRLGPRADQRAEWERLGIATARGPAQLPWPAPGARRGLIVGATLFGASRCEGAPFDRVAFDEAAQIALPQALLGLAAGRRFAFFGDDRQLGPVVVGDPDPALAPSIFAHLRAGATPVLLDETFRMNDVLARFPSTQFYEGRLRPTEEARGRRLALPAAGDGALDAVLGPEPPAILVTLAHEGYQRHCPLEARVACDLAESLLKRGLPAHELAVVSPFRVQNREIERELRRRFGPGARLPVIDTVERVQGQEREAVILSLACSDPDALRRDASFFFSSQRLNVTLTRARTKLIVIGSPRMLATYPRTHAGLVQVDLFHRLFQELPRVDWSARYG
ncbi:MAG: ATP-binding protein [Acidobacteria bacterium]|nr:ATP-binding protein [Acidobacteriota bacterium]